MGSSSVLEQLLAMETRFYAERDLVTSDQCVEFNVHSEHHCTPVGFLFGGISSAKATLLLLHQLECRLRGINGTVEIAYPRGVRAKERLKFTGEGNVVLGHVEEDLAISATGEGLRSQKSGSKLLEQGLHLNERFRGSSFSIRSTNTIDYLPAEMQECEAALLFHVICAADAGTWIFGQAEYPDCFFVTRFLSIKFHREPKDFSQRLVKIRLTQGNTSLCVNAQLFSSNQAFATLEAVLVNVDPLTGKKASIESDA